MTDKITFYERWECQPDGFYRLYVSQDKEKWTPTDNLRFNPPYRIIDENHAD